MKEIQRQSIQSLQLVMKFNEQKLATGTGFVVFAKNRPFLITNRHNLTGRRQYDNQPISDHGGVPNNIVIYHNKAGKLGEWVEKTEALYVNELQRWYEHPLLRNAADIAALPLSSLEDVALYPYDIENPGSDIILRPGEPVNVIGFPLGETANQNFAIWVTGFIASEPVIDFRQLPVFLIDCRTKRGQSGSPVIAQRSGTILRSNGSIDIGNKIEQRFLGIYSGRTSKDSDIGMVWKTSVLQQLVRAL